MSTKDIRSDSKRNAKYLVWGKLAGASFDLDEAIHKDQRDIIYSEDFSLLSSEADISNYKRWSWVKGLLNSNGFRSDEFIEVHNGKHVLFSGDSNTFGEGLEKHEMWSHIVYSELSKEFEVSGYFNLGSPGTSIQTCIINIFKYIKKYGKPDIIFINLTEASRTYDYIEDLDMYSTTRYESGYMKTIKLIVHDYYLMLEEYCESNGIQLYSFTWDTYDKPELPEYTNTNEVMQNFRTFYKNKDTEKMLLEMREFASEEMRESEFFFTARDGNHPGIGHNFWWAQNILKEYRNRNSK